MFLPSRGKYPWLARALSAGHGERESVARAGWYAYSDSLANDEADFVFPICEKSRFVFPLYLTEREKE